MLQRFVAGGHPVRLCESIALAVPGPDRQQVGVRSARASVRASLPRLGDRGVEQFSSDCRPLALLSLTPVRAFLSLAFAAKGAERRFSSRLAKEEAAGLTRLARVFPKLEPLSCATTVFSCELARNRKEARAARAGRVAGAACPPGGLTATPRGRKQPHCLGRAALRSSEPWSSPPPRSAPAVRTAGEGCVAGRDPRGLLRRPHAGLARGAADWPVAGPAAFAEQGRGAAPRGPGPASAGLIGRVVGWWAALSPAQSHFAL